MSEIDHVAELRAFADAWRESDARDSAHSPGEDGRRYFGNSWFQVPGTDVKLTEPQLRAALDELERLRTERDGETIAAKLRDAIRQINQWTARMDAYWPGWRELFEVPAVESAKAKFAADMDRLWKNDPGGAQWVEQILSERTGLSGRQAKLLAAIQREGGEWAPVRAQGVLTEAGYELTKERAHQIMKQLAERGYLEQVRPRAYTYRLKAEAPQQTENGSVK